MLLRHGTWPEVWIPPANLRDRRGLRRPRLALRHHTITWKNLLAGKGRVHLSVYVGSIPPETRWATRQEWELVDEVERHIQEWEKRARVALQRSPILRPAHWKCIPKRKTSAPDGTDQGFKTLLTRAAPS